MRAPSRPSGCETLPVDVPRVLRPLPDEDRVWYAGEEEQETLIDRRANGIPVHSSAMAQLKAIAEDLEVPFEL